MERTKIKIKFKMQNTDFQKILTMIVLLSTMVFSTYAQENNSSCSDALKEAYLEYEAGRFNASLEILKPCINSLEKERKFEAFRLQALCHLFLKDNKNADAAVVQLLKSNPNYREFPYFDPLSFTKLLSTFDVFPKFELGLKTSININSVNPIKNYSLTGSNAEFLPKAGFQGGVFIEYYLRRTLSLNAEFLYEGLNYSRVANDVLGWKQVYLENMKFWSIPITARCYLKPMKGWILAGELGFQTQFLSSTNSNVILSNNENQSRVQLTANQSEARKKTMFYGLAGASIKHKLAGGTISLNIRYAFGLNNVVNSDKRWSNTAFIFDSQYVDSDMKFNPLYFSVGYQVPIPGKYTVKKKINN
jgi:hypothetical protein